MKSLYTLCGISKQGHYQLLARQVQEEEMEILYIGFITQVREVHPGMGLRIIYERFAPEGIGRDAFIALGFRNGYRILAAHKTVRTTFSVKSNRYRNLLQDKRFTNVNQIWTSDITYFKLGEKTYFIVLIMDVYSRRIVGYSLADNMRAENNMTALQMALDLRGIKNYAHQLIHHSDKGGQYIFNDYTDLLCDFGISISMCNIVYENAHIERVNGTIKNQYLYRWEITNFMQLCKKLKDAIWAYNYDRPHLAHSQFGNLSPVEFEESLKELSFEQRPKLSIFTHSQNVDNLDDSQLKFDF